MIRFKKVANLILIVVLTLSVFGMTGCSGKKEEASAKDIARKNANIVIDEKNGITATYSENFNESYYNEEELETQINKEIDEINKTLESGSSISVEKFQVKDKVASLKLKFTDYMAYTKYSEQYIDADRNAKLYIGTYDEAVKAGYSMSGKFVEYNSGSEDSGKNEITSKDFKEVENLVVVYTNESKMFALPGEIVYSNSSVKVKDGVAKTTDKVENYIIYKLNVEK